MNLKRQIVDKIEVSYRTVVCYRNSTLKRFNDASIPSLALYAVLNGLSDIIDLILERIKVKKRQNMTVFFCFH